MIRSVLWHVLMLIWLAALLSGVWWLWPTLVNFGPAKDLVAGLLWLVIGACAWLIAFNFGRARYWRR